MAARDERIAQLKRLVADGARDLGVARTLAAAVDECAQRAKDGDRPALFGTVYALESFYSACEDLFARIERTYATIPAGERWHHDLLLGMSQTLDGMRPAVLRTETMVLLMPYLDFRRAAKHAIYQQGPLWTLMSDRVDGVHAVVAAVSTDWDAFAAWVRSQVDELER